MLETNSLHPIDSQQGDIFQNLKGMRLSQHLTTSRGTIHNRPAVLQDAASLHQLRLEALASSPTAFSSDYAAEASRSAADWIGRLEKNPDEEQGLIVVSADGEQLVGMCGLFREHSLKTRHRGTIWGVYVTQGWRGLRIADALIQVCVDWAQQEGMKRLELGVASDNFSAIRCYMRCGFSVYGIQQQAMIYEGNEIDELLMAKRI
jgi:RimJ/RimL family protein N-acetyltransferase